MSKRTYEDPLKKYDKVVLAPYIHLRHAPSGFDRSKIYTAFNQWLEIPEEKMRAIQEIGEMLQNCSLLFDDIEDNAISRRGVPSANAIYSSALTTNTAAYVSLLIIGKVMDLEHPMALSLYYEHMVSLHRGQGVEIYWRCNHYVPTDEEYEEMAIGKYSHMFMYLVNVMQLFSKNKTDYTKLLEKLGIYLSIRNDYSNLCASKNCKHETFASDISEGIFTFPISHACRVKEPDNKVLKIIKLHTQDANMIQYCLSLMEQYGSLQYTRDKLNSLDKQIRVLIAQLGGNPMLIRILDELSQWHEDN